MSPETGILAATAASVGVVHTLLGPDHYVPFVAMARAGGWSPRKTLWITALCGVGHVASSVVLGLVGIALGISLSRLEAIEAARGSLAAWALLAFGLVYLAWGLRRAVRGHRHSHRHVHADGTVHEHEHDHTGDHLHAHPEGGGRREMTPWILFTIFVFGPCEALIPLLMFPAATRSTGALFLVTGIFGVATVGTMLVLVGAAATGLHRARFGRLERYGHAAAGAIVAACGGAILFLGL